jgi:hypothetical protein
VYKKRNNLTTIKGRRQQYAGQLVTMPDYRAIKYFWGNQTEEGKQEEQN